MKMAKYRFHELKKQCPQWHNPETPDPHPLPDDVNAPVEAVAKRVGETRLCNQLVNIRTKKLYGTVVQYDAQHRPVAEFDFQHGMCPRFKLVQYDERTVFARSIHNDYLDMTSRRQATRNISSNSQGEKDAG